MGKNVLKVYIDPKSNQDKVLEVADKIAKMRSKVVFDNDVLGEFILVERNNHLGLSGTTNPIQREFTEDCNPVAEASEIVEIVDSIM